MSEGTEAKAARPTVSGTLVNIIKNPAQAMRDSEDRTIWLLVPLLLVIFTVILHVCVYYGQVDINWFHAQMASDSGNELPDEARRILQPGLLAFGTSVGVSIGMPIMFLAWGIWFWIVEKFTTGSQAHEFLDWFSLTTWSGIPLAFGSLLSILYILVIGAEQTPLNDTWFYSVNALFSPFPPNHPVSGMLSTATPFLVWMVWLCATGLAARTGRSMRKSLIIAALPVVVIFAIGTAGALD